MVADHRGQHVRGRLGALVLVFLLGSGGMMWLGSSGISKEVGDVLVWAAAFVALTFGLLFLRRMGRPPHAAATTATATGAAAGAGAYHHHRSHHHHHYHHHHQQRSCSPQALVGGCFARSGGPGGSSSGGSGTGAGAAAGAASNTTHHNHAVGAAASSSGFGTRLRQLLLGANRPMTLEEQHRRALALARAGASSSSGGGGGGGTGAYELSFLQLMERDAFDANDYELLSALDDHVDTSGRFGASEGELALLPLHTVGKAEAAAWAGRAGSANGSSGSGDGDGVVGVKGCGGEGGGSLAGATCTICLEAWEPGDVQRTLPCFHAFHRDCVDPWLRRRFQCPLCNRAVF